MTPLHPLVIAAVAAATLGTACLSQEPPSTNPYDAGTAAIDVHAYDFSDQPAELHELPRKPRIVLTTARPLDAGNDPVALFAGSLDLPLHDDLQRAPLQRAHQARRIPCWVGYGPGTTITLEPEAALTSDASYTLTIAGYARFTDGDRMHDDEEPYSAELHVSAGPSAGARTIHSHPAADASGVPTNLRFCGLVLDGEVTGIEDGVWLQEPSGRAVPAQIREVACDELASEGHTCIALVPDAALQPFTQYALRTGRSLRDRHGAEVAPTTSRFATAGGPDLEPARFQPTECAIDELPLPFGCALVDDRSLLLRAQASEPVRYLVRDDTQVNAALAPRGTLAWTRSDLQAAQTLELNIFALDAAQNEVRATVTLTTHAQLAPLSITEVLANPRGAEPTQEFVEITSFGAEPIALRGFSLSERADESGTPLDTDAIVYPGARVLLVPDGFDPAGPLDAAPPEGVTLVHVGKALGHLGLANAGEPLYLRDDRGQRVSAAPATPRAAAGVCIVRIVDDPRTGKPGSFGYDANGTCTPGR